MAKMPEALFKPRKRMIKDLQPGERASLPLYAILVDENRNAFLMPNAELGPPIDENVEYGEVWLDRDGKYHVDLKSTRWKWEPNMGESRRQKNLT